MQSFYLILLQIFIIIGNLFVNKNFVSADRGGFLHFHFLCYTNPGQYNILGDKCSSFTSNCYPYFTICISNNYIVDNITPDKCPIYYLKTNPFKYQANVCDKPKDNRENLGQLVIKELSFPLPKTIYVKIEIKDKKVFTSDKLIATFFTEYNNTPMPNLSNPVYNEISMSRIDYRYANPEIGMTIALILQCEADRFGDYCMKFCRALQTDHFTCSDHGDKICKKGWKGDDCNIKDICSSDPCIKEAICIDTKHEAKCICNGIIEPKCYVNYNPCQNGPCQNNGICILNKSVEIGYQCKCIDLFYGSFCENKVNICIKEPCQNNATCEYDSNNNRQCYCLEGFNGSLCENTYNISKNITDFNTTNTKYFASTLQINKSNVVLILSILFALLILLLTITFIIVCVVRKFYKKKPKMSEKSDKTIELREKGTKSNMFKAVSNDYAVICSVYETIGDRNTALYNVIENNEYMTPTFKDSPDCQTSTLSDKEYYLVMSLENDASKPSLNPVANRNLCELPELPSDV